MNSGMVIKYLSIFIALVLVSTFVLFVIGRINDAYFWVTIVVAAIFAYKIIPYLKKKTKHI